MKLQRIIQRDGAPAVAGICFSLTALLVFATITATYGGYTVAAIVEGLSELLH